MHKQNQRICTKRLLRVTSLSGPWNAKSADQDSTQKMNEPYNNSLHPVKYWGLDNHLQRLDSNSKTPCSYLHLFDIVHLQKNLDEQAGRV